MRVYTIWPADHDGLPASVSSAWQQDRRWLVLDITDGMEDAHIVEGPVSRQEACRRELEIRARDRQTAKTAKARDRQIVSSGVP